MLKKGWAYNMNPYVRSYLHRGLIFGGFGPIVLGIVYLIISLTGTPLNLSGFDLLLGIISTYVIAFVHAGSSVFNEVEKWGKAKSMLCQLSSLYVVYTGGYLINHCLPLDYRVILIFTGSFILGYLIIWFTVYLVTRKMTNKLNEKLKLEQEIE